MRDPAPEAVPPLPLNGEDQSLYINKLPGAPRERWRHLHVWDEAAFVSFPRAVPAVAAGSSRTCTLATEETSRRVLERVAAWPAVATQLVAAALGREHRRRRALE